MRKIAVVFYYEFDSDDVLPDLCRLDYDGGGAGRSHRLPDPSREPNTGEFVESNTIAPGNLTVIIPNSATQMARTDLGAAIKVRATVKPDELIYLEGTFNDTVFEGLSNESIPINVETRKLVRQDIVTEIMSSRIDKPIFRKVEKDFAVMLPYSAGSSLNARLIRESQSKYTYFIPFVLGNTAFGAPGKVELDDTDAPPNSFNYDESDEGQRLLRPRKTRNRNSRAWNPDPGGKENQAPRTGFATHSDNQIDTTFHQVF